jgi:hypothetical protein
MCYRGLDRHGDASRLIFFFFKFYLRTALEATLYRTKHHHRTYQAPSCVCYHAYLNTVTCKIMLWVHTDVTDETVSVRTSCPSGSTPSQWLWLLISEWFNVHWPRASLQKPDTHPQVHLPWGRWTRKGYTPTMHRYENVLQKTPCRILIL